MALRRRNAVVADVQLQVGAPERERDPDPACIGVLEHIRQRLLHDPVRGEVDGRGQPPRQAFDLECDVDPGRAHLLDELVESGNARLRRIVDFAVEHAENATKVGQSGARGAVDRPDRLARAGDRSPPKE